MNLHGIAVGCVGEVNPPLQVNILPNQGYTTNPDGTRVPAFGTPIPMLAQVQALTYTDLRQIDGLNITGIRRAIYLFGDHEGIVRVTQQGGDLVQFPDGTVWLIAYVPENWNELDGWVKVICSLQNGQ